MGIHCEGEIYPGSCRWNLRASVSLNVLKSVQNHTRREVIAALCPVPLPSALFPCHQLHGGAFSCSCSSRLAACHRNSPETRVRRHAPVTHVHSLFGV